MGEMEKIIYNIFGDIMNLYIIGNGFDMAHELKTSFNDFKKYMQEESKDSVDRWEKIINFNLNNDWSNLEESFEYVDYDYLVELCSYYLRSYNDENWSDSFHHDYQYELNKYLDLILQSDFYLREWLKNIKMPNNKKYYLDKDSIYLTFNYTNLLEKTYQISKKNICHIHGDLSINKRLVLGHMNPNIVDDIEKCFIDDDIRINEGKEIMNDSKNKSYKGSKTLISENSDFFLKCKNIKKIYIIGHSCDSIEKVDNEYYSKISSLVDKENIIVNVVYYDEKDINKYNEILTGMGYKNINFLTYNDIAI